VQTGPTHVFPSRLPVKAETAQTDDKPVIHG
jgi:hypothetical protein